jgi:dethiobiotin synthetase
MASLLRGFFVTGTDTGVGKTHTTALITDALRKTSIDAVAMKPFCCGDRDDAEILAVEHQSVLVEGVGGWRVPLTENFCASDFALELGLQVLVVCSNRLGMLNHTQLTVDAIIAKGLNCAGVIINQPEPPSESAAVMTNAAILERLLPVPVFGEIPFGAPILPPLIFEKIEALLRAAD